MVDFPNWPMGRMFIKINSMVLGLRKSRCRGEGLMIKKRFTSGKWVSSEVPEK